MSEEAPRRRSLTQKGPGHEGRRPFVRGGCELQARSCSPGVACGKRRGERDELRQQQNEQEYDDPPVFELLYHVLLLPVSPTSPTRRTHYALLLHGKIGKMIRNIGTSKTKSSMIIHQKWVSWVIRRPPFLICHET